LFTREGRCRCEPTAKTAIDSGSLLDFALLYAADDRYVLPCSRSTKRPRTAHGLLDASCQEDVIRSWPWSDEDAAIGMRTGAVSRIVVLDIDGESGEESLIELERSVGPLPATREVLTPHGRHLHYVYPEGVSLVRCAVAYRGLAGLDIRGDGGYVIVPPTPGYMFEVSSTAPALLPMTLIAMSPVGDKPKVDDEFIPNGTRNTRLASLGGTMRRRGMSEAAIRAALLADNRTRCRPPLPDDEVIAIAQSVSRYPPGESVGQRAHA
jgi:putative DNA primase/helicase